MKNVILKDFGKTKMYLIANDPGISTALMKPNGYKNREPEFMEVLRRELPVGSVAMDIGANIGFVTLAMCHNVTETGFVYAVEPVIENYNVMVDNVALNGFTKIVHTENLAVSKTDGVIDFYLSNYSNLGSIRKFKKADKGITSVKCVCLDNYLVDKKLPLFYKMDIEGAEVDVITGMQKIADSSPNGTKILMEVHPQFYRGNEMEIALISLLKLGFYFKYVISAGTPCPKLFSEKGYKPIEVFKSGAWTRGLFTNIKEKDAVRFTAYPHEEYIPERKKTTPKIVRAIMLEKR